MSKGRSGPWCCLVLCWWLWLPSVGGAEVDDACRSHFRDKAYGRAGACFASHIPGSLQGLAARAKTVAGRRMRNASLSYHRAVKAAKDPGKQAYYREQAVALLQRYLRHKLYESKHRKTSAIVLLHALQQGLYYAPVTVLSGHPKAAIEIKGFHFQARAVGRWSGRLRAGGYRVTVQTPGVKAPLVRQLQIRSRRPQVLSLGPGPALKRPTPPPQRMISPAAWWLLGGGGAILLAAGLTLGFASLSADEARALNDSPGSSLEKYQKIDALTVQTNALATTSTVCWAVGGAAVLSGGLLLFFPVVKPSPATPPPPARRSSARLWRWGCCP